MAQGDPGRAQTLATTIPLSGATSTGATLAPAVGFRVSHSNEDLHTQLRQVPRTLATQHAVHPRAVAPTFDGNHDAPVVEDSVLFVDAHRSQARCRALFFTSSP